MGQGPDGEAANPQPPASISCKVGEEVIPHGSQCSLRTCSSWAGWNACSDHSRRATAAPVGWGLGGHPAQLGTVHWVRGSSGRGVQKGSVWPLGLHASCRVGDSSQTHSSVQPASGQDFCFCFKQPEPQRSMSEGSSWEPEPKKEHSPTQQGHTAAFAEPREGHLPRIPLKAVLCTLAITHHLAAGCLS